MFFNALEYCKLGKWPKIKFFFTVCCAAIAMTIRHFVCALYRLPQSRLKAKNKKLLFWGITSCISLFINHKVLKQVREERYIAEDGLDIGLINFLQLQKSGRLEHQIGYMRQFLNQTQMIVFADPHHFWVAAVISSVLHFLDVFFKIYVEIE